MSRLLRFLPYCLILLAGLAQPLAAQNLEDEIDGILIDRTVTLVGFRFVSELGAYRRANEIKTSENLTVFERPSARWGSLIWVTAGNDELYRSFVGPRLGEIPVMAQQASDQIEANFVQLKLRRLLTDRFDLDTEEF